MSLEEQKAKARHFGYRVAAVASVAGPLLSVALEKGGFANWVALTVAIVSALTAGTGVAVAARKTGQQINEGKFSESSPADPVQSVIEGLQAITDAASAANQAKDTVTQAAADVIQQWGIPAAKTVEQALSDIAAGRLPGSPR
jgi:hypothetical protein